MSQEVKNAELERDIKYIRKSLDEIVSSLKDMKTRMNTLSEQVLNNKFKIEDVQSDIKENKKNIDDLWKIVWGVISFVFMSVGGAVLGLVIL